MRKAIHIVFVYVPAPGPSLTVGVRSGMNNAERMKEEDNPVSSGVRTVTEGNMYLAADFYRSRHRLTPPRMLQLVDTVTVLIVFHCVAPVQWQGQLRCLTWR